MHDWCMAILATWAWNVFPQNIKSKHVGGRWLGRHTRSLWEAIIFDGQGAAGPTHSCMVWPLLKLCEEILKVVSEFCKSLFMYLHTWTNIFLRLHTMKCNKIMLFPATNLKLCFLPFFHFWISLRYIRSKRPLGLHTINCKVQTANNGRRCLDKHTACDVMLTRWDTISL